MIEIYQNVSQDAKNLAEAAWNIVLTQKNPVDAAKFLNSITEYSRYFLNDEDVEFLQFYFNMKMEMMKE